MTLPVAPAVALAMVVSALLALTVPLVSQSKRKKDAWKLDPYTAGKPEAIKRAGYVAYGPLVWGEDHDTRTIDKMMPEAKILWVETKHFRIGSSMGALPMPKDSKAQAPTHGRAETPQEDLPEDQDADQVHRPLGPPPFVCTTLGDDLRGLPENPAGRTDRLPGKTHGGPSS